MTANSNRGSAKIYQFPAGGRAGLGSRGDAARPVEEFAASRVARVASAAPGITKRPCRARSAPPRTDIACRRDAGPCLGQV